VVELVGDFSIAIIEPLIGLALGREVSVGVLVVNGRTFVFTFLPNLIITLVVISYALVAPLNRMRRKQAGKEVVEAAEDVVLLTQIRDLLDRREPAPS
jgi:large-conductance mechanosensitive channel